MAPTRPTKSEAETKRPPLSELDPALSKVCRDILKLSDESTTVLALRRAEITNITILINTTDGALDLLTYLSPRSTLPHPISSVALVQVRGFIRWCDHLREASGGILPADDEICDVDPAEFNEFDSCAATPRANNHGFPPIL